MPAGTPALLLHRFSEIHSDVRLTFASRGRRLSLRLQSQHIKIYARWDFSRVKNWRGGKLLRRRSE